MFRVDGIFVIIVIVNVVGSRTITAIETDGVVGTKADQRKGRPTERNDELARQEYELFLTLKSVSGTLTGAKPLRRVSTKSGARGVCPSIHENK